MSQRRRALPLLVVLAGALSLGACGPATGSSTTVSPPTGSTLGPAPRLTAPTRPKAIADVNIDYATLPVLESLPLPAGTLGPSLGRAADGTFHPNSPKNSITLLQVGAVAPVYIVGGNDKDPPYVTHPERVPQMCSGGGGGPIRATWMTFVSPEKLAESLIVTRFEGTFDAALCAATPERFWKVKAQAIVPATVYAYRSRGAIPLATNGAVAPNTQPTSTTPTPTPSALPAGLAMGERLEVIGPRSIWVGSDAPTELQNQKLQEPFARLIVPVQRGSSASAVLDVASDDLKAFRGSVLPGIGDARVVAFSFDVVWAESESAPSATAFVSALPGTPEQLAPAQQYNYETTGSTIGIDFLE